MNYELNVQTLYVSVSLFLGQIVAPDWSDDDIYNEDLTHHHSTTYSPAPPCDAALQRTVLASLPTVVCFGLRIDVQGLLFYGTTQKVSALSSSRSSTSKGYAKVILNKHIILRKATSFWHYFNQSHLGSSSSSGAQFCLVHEGGSPLEKHVHSLQPSK